MSCVLMAKSGGVFHLEAIYMLVKCRDGFVTIF